MKKILLILTISLFCLISKAQQYYKVTRYDVTKTKVSVRIESTVTPNFVEKIFADPDKPKKDKKKETIKKLIDKLRLKDSLSLSTPDKPKSLPEYYDKNN